jgi:hypothetical protein
MNPAELPHRECAAEVKRWADPRTLQVSAERIEHEMGRLPSLTLREVAIDAQARRDERRHLVKLIRERAAMAKALLRFGGARSHVDVLLGLADEIERATPPASSPEGPTRG